MAKSVSERVDPFGPRSARRGLAAERACQREGKGGGDKKVCPSPGFSQCCIIKKTKKNKKQTNTKTQHCEWLFFSVEKTPN